MKRASLALVAVVGCDDVFDIETVPHVDAAVDSRVDVCLQDTFDGPDVDVSQWRVFGMNGGTVGVDAGQLAISIPEAVTTTTDPYGGISSSARDLSGLSAEVEVLGVAATAAPSETVVQLFAGTGNSYGIVIQRGLLITRKVEQNVKTTDMVAYDPVAHRFVRLRHDADAMTVFYETSPEGAAWLQIAQTPATVSLAAVNLEVYAGSFDVAPSFVSTVDNVRVVGTCPF